MGRHVALEGARMPKGGDRGGRKPPLPPEKKRVQVGVRLPPHLRDKLQALADARHQTITQVIETLIEEAPGQ